MLPGARSPSPHPSSPPQRRERHAVSVAGSSSPPPPPSHGREGGLGAQLVASPGDVFFVRGAGRIAAIGAAGGMFGHCLVAIGPSAPMGEESGEAWLLQQECPEVDLRHVWRVPTLEATRLRPGLHSVEVLAHQDPESGKLRLLGTYSRGEDLLGISEGEILTLLVSPTELRMQLHPRIVAAALLEMQANKQSWSLATGVRATMRPSAVQPKGKDGTELLQEVKDAWDEAPICTSVAVAFWQRVLCRFAQATGQGELELILRWMPVMADRCLPSELFETLRRSGFAPLERL